MVITKIFRGEKPEELENAVNKWLRTENIHRGQIISISQSQSQGAAALGSGSVTLSIFYGTDLPYPKDA